MSSVHQNDKGKCRPQEFEDAKTKNLPKFQQVPTNVFFFFFWAHFCHLAKHQKNGCVKAQKELKLLNVTTF
jgi:hypothetical protein